jgi:hypothetical protein
VFRREQSLKYIQIIFNGVDIGGVMVIVLAIAPKFRGFKPGRERLIFKGNKNP